MKMKDGAREIDPQAELKKAMGQMSPEQQKQMMAMMGKSGLNLAPSGNGGTQICYTKDLLSQMQNLGHDPSRNCESKITEQNSKRMAMDFTCKDGSTGKGEWNFKSSNAYEGKMQFTKDGRVSEVTQKAKFLSSNCGNIKPFAPKTPGAMQ